MNKENLPDNFLREEIDWCNIDKLYEIKFIRYYPENVGRGISVTEMPIIERTKHTVTVQRKRDKKMYKRNNIVNKTHSKDLIVVCADLREGFRIMREKLMLKRSVIELDYVKKVDECNALSKYFKERLIE